MAKNKKLTKWLPYAIILLLLVVGLSWFFYAQSMVSPPPLAAETSSISVTDWTSRESLDELCPVTVRGDKGGITETANIYDDTYYETVKAGVMPAAFGEDLSKYEYIKITVNPDEATAGWWTVYDYVFKNDFKNYEYSLYGHHEATDLYGNVLDVVGGDEWNLATDGNYTIPLWYPTVTTTERHLGRYFAIEDDLADLSAATLAKLNNEKYYRDMPTLFSLADDVADHSKIGDYAMITETFAIKFDFNATINTTDGSVFQVNFTADCDYDFLIETDDDKLYFVTTESWNTINGNFEMNFEITTAANIMCEAVYAGRVLIPDRFFGTSYTFSSLQILA